MAAVSSASIADPRRVLTGTALRRCDLPMAVARNITVSVTGRVSGVSSAER